MASTKIIQKNKAHILYDASIISKPSEHIFNPQWLAQQAEIKQIGEEDMAMGRGAAWFVDYDNQQWVLRHYQRGGMVARWNKQHYLGWSLSNTRAWQEWYLLNSLYSQGLAVPQPLAACVSWSYGRILGLYKAAILLKRIPQALTLAEKCQHKAMHAEAWQEVGRCIKKFHRYGVYHADLNANNILFNEDGKVYLIDFDKGGIKSDGIWKTENLNRLQRSLLKLQGMYDEFGFSEEDWVILMEAYKG